MTAAIFETFREKIAFKVVTTDFFLYKHFGSDCNSLGCSFTDAKLSKNARFFSKFHTA